MGVAVDRRVCCIALYFARLDRPPRRRGGHPRDERYVNDMLAHIGDADEILPAGEGEFRLPSSMLLHQMRSLLGHHYEGIQRKVVWDTLKYDQPRVRDLLTQALDDLAE